MSTMKPSVILFPTPDIGHLAPTIELSKLFVKADFSVTVVLITETPHVNPETVKSFISSLPTSFTDTVNFHQLPKISLPSTFAGPPIAGHLEIIRLASAHLLEYLKQEVLVSDIRALVVDMFCTDAIGVAEEIGVPSYAFFSCGASSLVAHLQLKYLQSKLPPGRSFQDEGVPVEFPGLPVPVPVLDLPIFAIGRNPINDLIMRIFEDMMRADGIIVNTFERLERRAVVALANDVIIPGRKTPPVYCVGPLMGASSGGEHPCLDWLDAQPEKSVVFVCFGSMGNKFSHEQVKEMEAGLERSGQRYLWVVKDPLIEEGINGKGMVVKSWVPQRQILNHASVGAFFSHGGWNSTLEAVSAGVPMVIWPLYAEQGMNRVLLEEVVKIAVGIEGYKEGLVGAAEVEKKIRWVMESEEANELKKRVGHVKIDAAAAWEAGGSSERVWLEIVSSLKEKNDQ